MPNPPAPIRTERVVHLLLDHGFIPRRRAHGRTEFKHAAGAIITVPDGWEEVPPAFVGFLVRQSSAMGLSTVDDVVDLLLR